MPTLGQGKKEVNPTGRAAWTRSGWWLRMRYDGMGLAIQLSYIVRCTAATVLYHRTCILGSHTRESADIKLLIQCRRQQLRGSHPASPGPCISPLGPSSTYPLEWLRVDRIYALIECQNAFFTIERGISTRPSIGGR